MCKECSEDFEFNSNRKIQTRAALSRKMVSSNIDEVIRSVLNFLFFLQKDFTSIKKHKPLTVNKNKKCVRKTSK